MARVCQVTGKAPMVGNNVSHANNKTKRRFMPNLQRRRFWVESENRWISLRLTNAGLRTIDHVALGLANDQLDTWTLSTKYHYTRFDKYHGRGKQGLPYRDFTDVFVQ